MKKYLIICLVVLIIVSGTNIDSFADTAIDKQLEAAVLKVKNLFKISDEYDTFNSNVSSDLDNMYFYMNWSDSNLKLDSISVTTDSLGNVISYNKYKPIYEESETRIANYSKEEALKIGLEFIEKINKDIYNEIELIEDKSHLNTFDNEYRFSFNRLVNGIPFMDNTVNISINKYTGKVVSFYSNWDRDMIFPNPEGILSLDEGKKAYINNIGLDLIYKTTYRIRPLDTSTQEAKHYLVYSTINANKAIDAFTGEATNSNYYGPYIGMQEVTKDSASGGVRENAVITPEERKEIEKLSGIVDVAKVEEEARKILNIDSEYVLYSNNLYTDYNNPDQYTWSLYFQNQTDNNYWHINISLNAKTLELLSFYKFDNEITNEKPTITKDEALEFAKEFIEKVQPNKIEEIEYYNQDIKEDQQSYYFTFTRKIDDIYVVSDSISVTVDAVNKEIDSYSFEWYKGKFPPMGEVIGLDKAYDILFNKIGYDLKYTIVYDYDNADGNKREIKLVYAVDSKLPLNIDAHSGEILDYSGKLYKEPSIFEYDDIDNSYARDKIETLSQYGVGFNSSKFKPKDKIKQKDFLYLLFKSRGYYGLETEEDIDKIYEELTDSRIIREGEKYPESLVTKEEAVKFIIRAMSYDKVAEIPNIYSSIFKDSSEITPGFEGYINIGYGLGLINGDGSGKIRPRAELKREDAASLIYNYMFN